MYKNVLLLFLICSIVLPAQSQILNVEENRLLSDSVNQFYGNLKFRFQIHNRSATQDDKIRYTGLSLASQFGYLSELHNYMLISDLKYNSVTGQPFIRTGYSHFRINFFRENATSYETFTQLQFDLGRGLTLRWLAGGGLRIRLVDEEDLRLYFGPGVMFEREKWENPFDRDEIIEKELIKSTNYLSYFHKLSETTIFNLTLYFQTGYDQESETWRQRYSFDTGLKFNISNKVSFVVDFAWAYETRPVVPILQYIYTLENGIVIAF
jgi:hypothetical protein